MRLSIRCKFHNDSEEDRNNRAPMPALYQSYHTTHAPYLESGYALLYSKCGMVAPFNITSIPEWVGASILGAVACAP